MMRIATYEKREAKQKEIETYTADKRLKYCGSMFFRFYTIMCFSGFNCKIKKDGNDLRKKIDTEILLALTFVKFVTTYCNEKNELLWRPRKRRPKEWHPKKYKPISFKDLTIVWGLIFDENSEWNRELKRVLEDSGYENILDQEPPESYKHFFGKDDEWIEKTGFSKLLAYLPKSMFFDCVVWILNCNNHVIIDEDDIRNTKILGYSRQNIRGHFKYALRNFSLNPSKEEMLKGFPKGSDEKPFLMGWRNYYGLNKDKLFKSFKWKWAQDKKLHYDSLENRNYPPSSERWESVMEGILTGIQIKTK